MSLLGPFVMDWRGSGKEIFETVTKGTDVQRTWFFDTIKYTNDAKTETTVRRTAISGSDDYNFISDGLIKDPRDDFQLVMADVDASIFSPTCLECGKKQTNVIQFEREIQAGDKMPNVEPTETLKSVVINLSTCSSPLCRHKLRCKVKAEAKKRGIWVRQLFKKRCDNCKKVSEKVQVCSVCRLVKYCDRECQKAHWKTHKVDCKVCKD